MTKIDTVVFDFDGTCTDIPAVEDKFLAACFEALETTKWATPSEWANALAAVRSASPEAGWLLGGTPSAPAAADPYILSGEAVAYLGRKRGIRPSEFPNVFEPAYQKALPSLRPELGAVLRELYLRKIGIAFVSNSGPAKINAKLDELLLSSDPALRAAIQVQGSSAKYAVVELAWDDPSIAAGVRQAFEALPATAASPLHRPLYLRRGSYMTALSKVWNGDMSRASSTLVCGDIWELDLALPAALGCAVHLMERAAPYQTYDYERAAAADAGATVSSDLTGVIARLKA